jgi:DNA-directed RNA polymerase sigma subunit (sigma70/sigma32)
MLMIWSSLARNRSPTSVVIGFFGRIVPSDATPNHAERFEGISNTKSQASGARALKSLQSRTAIAQKNRIQLRDLTGLHEQLSTARQLSEAPPKLETLASEYGITRERVRQIELRCFEKVKAAMHAAESRPDAL